MQKNTGVICPKCDSKNVGLGGRYIGFRKTCQGDKQIYIRQKYKCKNCHKTFAEEPAWMHFDISIITDAINYSFDHTFREAAEYIKKKYGLYISFNTIVRWTNTYLETGKVFGIKIYKYDETLPTSRGIKIYDEKLPLLRISVFERINSLEKRIKALEDKHAKHR